MGNRFLLPDIEPHGSPIQGKSILITGACGTVGSGLVRQLLTDPGYGPAEVVGIDNNESQLFFIDQKYLHDSRAHFFVADIRDRDELTRKMAGIDIVFHCAALKHVILCERSPEQAVKTTSTACRTYAAAQASGVEKDLYQFRQGGEPDQREGTSKLMGKRPMTAANSNQRGKGPIFASTRFGNVLGSNGR